MRCKNCGWENKEYSDICEKCHSKLDNLYVQDGVAHVSERLRGTVSEKIASIPEPKSINNQQCASQTCPKCGYPLSPTSKVCPNCNALLEETLASTQSPLCRHCGFELPFGAKFCPSCGESTLQDAHHIQTSGLGTVMGGPSAEPIGVHSFCTLRPIAWAGEDVNYKPVTYTGQSIILSRSNTDANNNTITSREQAVLTYEDGEWFIENKSDLRTTYIRVGGKTRLTSGDIIVLGNREFEFKG